MHGLAELRERHRGPIIGVDDRGFDEARATFNGMIERRPELIARPLDVGDVVTAVLFARDADLPVAVRGGGHGVAGHCIGDGSLVVDLRLMRQVVVEPDLQTATCGGGSLWEDLDTPSQRHGLATPGGTFGDTGIAGLTLGGGIGHLTPSYGLTLDNLLGATVVTADGSVLSASENENAELFWALRDVLPVWRDVMANAPDSLASFAQVARDAVTGEGLVNASVAWVGDLEAGREAIRELTEGLSPVKNTVRPMYYSELQDLYGRMPFGLRNYWSGRFLAELPDELLALTSAQFIELGTAGGVLFEPLHGAPTRVASDATAFAGREAHWNATFINVWTEPDEDERQIETARAYSSALEPWKIGGGYLNYATEASAGGLETVFGSQRFERLRAVKRQYDPSNVFRFNHNIAPD